MPRRLVMTEKRRFVEVVSRIVDEKYSVLADEIKALVLFFCFWYICLWISRPVERQRRSAFLRSRLAFRIVGEYQGAEGRSLTAHVLSIITRNNCQHEFC